MLEGARVDAIRDMAARGWSIKAIARATGVSRNAVRRYLRTPRRPRTQTRPNARRLDESGRLEARRLFRVERENATQVHRILAAASVIASVRTLQRAVADLRGVPDDRRTRHARPPSQEPSSSAADLEVVRRIAHSRRTHDRDELESELTRYLVGLERRRPYVRNWTAFLIKSLNNHARRWLGARQREGELQTSLQRRRSTLEDSPTETGDIVEGPVENLDDRLALAQVRGLLDPWLRRVWDGYVASGLSQTAAAKLLGVHRNTVARALHRIRQTLKDHGF